MFWFELNRKKSGGYYDFLHILVYRCIFLCVDKREHVAKNSFHLDHPLLREAQDDLSWEAMFREMAINIGDKKKIVVIDEF